MATEDVAALRRELSRHEKGRGRRYPVGLKARVASYARCRRAEGASYDRIAEAVGLGYETVRRWALAEAPAPVRLRAVELVAESSSTPTLVSPSGFRLEGLSPFDAVAALRALG